jgi:MarR family transcriptional regulator for hemolysin
MSTAARWTKPIRAARVDMLCDRKAPDSWLGLISDDIIARLCKLPASFPGDPIRNFGFLLRDLSRLYALNFERHGAELNLTLAQCRVLCYLQRNEGISQAWLASLTDTDPMTLTRILGRMEADGLIEREADPADRRAHRLFLRQPALPVLEEIWRISDRARAESLSGLSAAERTQLMELMQRLQSNLESLMPDSAHVPAALPGQAKKRTRMHAQTAKA